MNPFCLAPLSFLLCTWAAMSWWQGLEVQRANTREEAGKENGSAPAFDLAGTSLILLLPKLCGLW